MDSIICLQEVSLKWSGELHSYFSNKNYYLITNSYGNKFNGYMGVAIAVPLSNYDIRDVNIARISDNKRLPYNNSNSTGSMSLFKKLFSNIKRIYFGISKVVTNYKPPDDLWSSVLYRSNQMICLRLTSKLTNKNFSIGTYHMVNRKTLLLLI